LDSAQKILQQIEFQIRKKMSMKKGYRKKMKVTLEKSFRALSHKIFSSLNSEIQRYSGNSMFGCDELGRDVEAGLQKYIRLLKRRGVQMHVVIVLGSRAKGKWGPQSDIDVTIIADNLPKEGRNVITKRLFDLRRRILLSDRPLYLGIEPSGCCSREEFLKRLRQFDIQTLDAVFYGKVIYDDGFWQIVQANYKELSQKYGLEKFPLKEMLVSV